MMTRPQGILRILAILLAAGWLTGSVADVCAQQASGFPAAADSFHLATLDDDDLLVLEVRLESRSSGHGLLAYRSGDEVLLPLAELCSILELALQVDPTAGVAEGWIIDESRTFRLDARAGVLETEGTTVTLPPGSVAVDDGDIYLRSDVVQRRLPIDIILNFARMNVTLLPREVLPYQERRRRDEQRAEWLAGHGRKELAYPLRVTPYRMWSWPLTDATFSLQSTTTGTQRRFSSQSWADVAGLSGNLFLSHVSSEERSRTTARVKAGRWDVDGGLLGPAGATHFEFGDLYLSRIPLISARKQGVGFTVTNDELNRSREFDTTVVEGDAPPGWEAELYINGTLFDFQEIGDEGRYVFTDVPMVMGDNSFRTVLYGPRGEKRTVVDHANISPEMTDVGELKYTATLLKEGSALLNEDSAAADGVTRPWSQQLELSYAMSNRSALVANLSRLGVLDRRELFFSLASHNSLGRVNLESVGAASQYGGRAVSLGARTNLHGHTLVFQSNLNDEYRAESPDGQSYIHRRTVLRAGGNLILTARRGLYYGVSTADRMYRDGDLQREREAKFRLSGNVGRLLLSHSLRSSHKIYGSGETTSLLGTQLLRTWIGPLSVRASVNYELSPGRVRSLTATGTMYRDDLLQATLRLNRYLRDDFGNDGVTLEVTRLFDAFTVGANLNYFEDQGATFGITVGTFLARDNRSSTWSTTHRRLANRAAASVRTFIDLDNDGEYDGEDIPLEGVGFLNLLAWRDIRTNENGIALLPGIHPHRAQTIELDMATVDDPYLMPVAEGVNVLGHPGGIVDVELPFAYAGEIEGVIVDAGDREREVRNVGLELLDRDGERIAATVSEFDGFYYFSGVLPGTYVLQVVPSTVNSLIYETPEPLLVIVPGDGGFLSGPDVVLRRKHRDRAPEDLPMILLPAAYAPGSGGDASRVTDEAVVDVVPAEDGPAAPGAEDDAEPEPPAHTPVRMPRDRNCTGK